MKVIAIHDVDDVQRWFDSPKRAEFFEARGMKVMPFRDPTRESSSVAVLIETPDMETLECGFRRFSYSDSGRFRTAILEVFVRA